MLSHFLFYVGNTETLYDSHSQTRSKSQTRKVRRKHLAGGPDSRDLVQRLQLTRILGKGLSLL